MKNIQVIDGAKNCTYDIFCVSDGDFELIFPDEGQDIEFLDDFVRRVGQVDADAICERMWCGKAEKTSVQGIHGTLFIGLEYKKVYYPTKCAKEMIVMLD